MRLLCGASASLLVLAIVAGCSLARADALRRVEHTISEPEQRPAGDGAQSTRAATDGARSTDAARRARPLGNVGMEYEEGWAAGERDGARDDDTDLMLLNLVGRALGFAWVIPHWFDDPSLGRYASHPYADGPALLRSTEPDASSRGDSTDVLLQLDAETGFLWEGVVPASFGLRLLLPHRVELSSRTSLLNDVYQAGQSMVAASTSHLALRFAQMQRVEFRTGVGARMFTLHGPAWGVDLLYAVDAYLWRRSILRVELHAGTLGNAFAGQARATLGVMVKRCELYAGYDHTAILGNGKTTLGGPIAGLRAWF